MNFLMMTNLGDLRKVLLQSEEIKRSRSSESNSPESKTEVSKHSQNEKSREHN